MKTDQKGTNEEIPLNGNNHSQIQITAANSKYKENEEEEETNETDETTTQEEDKTQISVINDKLSPSSDHDEISTLDALSYLPYREESTEQPFQQGNCAIKYKETIRGASKRKLLHASDCHCCKTVGADYEILLIAF